MMFQESFEPDFCLILPFHQGISGIEHSIHTFLCQQYSYDSGVVYLYGFCPQFLDLPGMVKDRQGKGHRIRDSRLEDKWFFVPEKMYSTLHQHGIDHGSILEPDSPCVVASESVGV